MNTAISVGNTVQSVRPTDHGRTGVVTSIHGGDGARTVYVVEFQNGDTAMFVRAELTPLEDQP